jgi:hypothetical protein
VIHISASAARLVQGVGPDGGKDLVVWAYRGRDLARILHPSREKLSYLLADRLLHLTQNAFQSTTPLRNMATELTVIRPTMVSVFRLKLVQFH